ncbi:MAG TPA: proline--tRNA ligase [Phycisphaerales bacterium]|nr:proline--tRNA ligase [Phycisphaerales bacterium]
MNAGRGGARAAGGHGTIESWRRTLIPTTREAPADAESPSHVLLSRAGYIRKLGSGIYDYLPLALRVLTKISAIVRQEMNAAGASELLLPVLLPVELYAQTRRDEAYGDLLFKVTDRRDAVAALGPTHEEPITELVKGSITSYKQLPLNLYQVQTKFRDEARPRSGLLRCREFIMKDAYSFHLSVDGPGGLGETYDAMHRAYVNIFTRCGLDFTVVEAESGPIGGSASHEFMVNCASGEDTILRCRVSGYAANVEKCEIGAREWGWDGTADGPSAAPLAKHHTPNMPGIDLVAARLGVTPAGMLKTVVFKVAGEGAQGGPAWVLATVRGDHEVNEGKVKAAVGRPVVLADEREARAAGFAIGYVSPRVVCGGAGRGPDGLCKTLLLVDPDAAQGRVSWATGADEPDHHVTGFAWSRDMGAVLADAARVRVADIRNARAGDPSPRAPGACLETGRGIEVGHIFKLGTKYSEAMGLAVLDKDQKKQPVIMGCYGIGVSRTMAACVEISHDADGIMWPPAIAPYHVLITVMKPDQASHAEAAARLADELAGAGLDVLIDDRDERPGVKFKDADLIGIPVRLTIGDKSLAEGAVEFKRRGGAGKGENVPLGEAAERCAAVLGAAAR